MNNKIKYLFLIGVIILGLMIGTKLVSHGEIISPETNDPNNTNKIENNELTPPINTNTISLTYFKLSTTEAFPSSVIGASIETNGANLIGVKVIFKNYNNNVTFSSDLNMFDNTLEIPSTAAYLSYIVEGIELTATGNDGNTFTKLYSLNGSLPNSTSFPFDNIITIKKNNVVHNLELTALNLDKKIATINEKINLTYEATENLNSMSLRFKNKTTSDILKLNVSSLNNNPYIELPKNTVIGDYELERITISSINNLVTYDASMPFDITLKVKLENEQLIECNNEDIDANLIKNIRYAPNKITINVHANNKTFLGAEIFSAIRESNKILNIIYEDFIINFEGKNINGSVALDLGVKLTSGDEAKLKHKGYFLDFSKISRFPGKFTVKIPATQGLKSTLGENINVYTYKDQGNTFNLYQKDIKLNGEYYEFEISDRLKYFITKDYIKSPQELAEEAKKQAQTKKRNSFILLFLFAILGIGAITFIIIINFKKKKKIPTPSPQNPSNQA